MSWILPRAEAMLTEILSRFAITEDNLLEAAPNAPRRVDIVDIALSIVAKALRAELAESTSISAPIAVAVSYTHLTLPTSVTV